VLNGILKAHPRANVKQCFTLNTRIKLKQILTIIAVLREEKPVNLNVPMDLFLF